MHSDEKELEFRTGHCNDLRTLEWVANMGTIPLHLPAARIGNLELPTGA